jgi:transcriptional regulator with XRE-family HTH domain
MSSRDLDELRRAVAAKVRTLRKARGWTQGELATQLGLSQGRFSVIERGEGSFTAEQLLVMLRLFNVAATDFAPKPRDETLGVQNALVRLGATHLVESQEVGPREDLLRASDAIFWTLVEAPAARLITALAPILVLHIEDVSLKRLEAQLRELRLERRLFWLVDNTRTALKEEHEASLSRVWKVRYRRASTVLDAFLDSVPTPSHSRARRRAPALDIFDRSIRSRETLEASTHEASPAAKRWGIVTSLRTEDFAVALREARESNP